MRQWTAARSRRLLEPLTPRLTSTNRTLTSGYSLAGCSALVRFGACRAL